MKRLLVLLTLSVLVVSSFANDLPRVNLSRTFVDADTLIWTDTAFGDWGPIDGATSLHFFVRLGPPVADGVIIDTNFAADSFFINVQLSFDRVNISRTFELDTLLDDGNVWTGNDVVVADSIRGNWMRAMIIWRDTTNILTSGAIIGNTYGKLFELFYSMQK